jgi:Ni/Co efflux regulator RcnB
MKQTFGLLIAFGALMFSPAMADDNHPHGGVSHAPAPHAPGHAAFHGAPPRMGGSFRTEHRPPIRTVHTSRTVHVHPSHATVVRRTTAVTRAHHVTVRNVSVHRHVTPATAHRHVTNVRALRRNFTAPRRFHHGAYVRPAGWYSHRWTYGERLPGGWYGHNYWIVNFSLFGLVYPPDGYEWIRVGDDALLVDVDTGEIVRVEYGVFY